MYSFNDTILTAIANNSNDSIEHEFYDDEPEIDQFFDLRLSLTWLSLFVIIFGIFSNIISIILLNKSRSSTNIYLSGVCVSSVIALIGFLINSVLYNKFIYYKYIAGIKFLMILYPFIYPLITTAQISFVLLTVSVSLNQYFIVSSKIEINNSKKAQLKECKKAFNYVIIVYLFSFVYCSPYWFMFKYDRENGLEKTELNQNYYFKRIVHFCLYLPIAFVLPFSILMTTNIYLIMTLNTRYQKRKKLNKASFHYRSVKIGRKRSILILKEKDFLTLKDNFEMRPSPSSENSINKNGLSLNAINKTLSYSNLQLNSKCSSASSNSNLQLNSKVTAELEVEHSKKKCSLTPANTALHQIKIKNKNVTILLIAVVSFFLLCQTPSMILNVNEALKDSDLDVLDSATQVYAAEFAKLFLIVNSSFNCAIFYFFSKKFRKDFKRVFQIKKK